MANLYLVRHGQASFGTGDYDRLSSRGWEQSRILGRWLARTQPPDAVFCGAMRRHRETVEGVADGCEPAIPEARVLDGLNEFDHESVIRAWRPEWADRHRMAEDLRREPHPARAFQQSFTEAVRRWAGGGHDEDYPESWPRFRERVLSGLEQVISLAGDARHTLVVSSGGPISVMVQSLLDLDDRRTLKLNEVLANAGLTRVLYSGERRSLAVFNSFAHLEEAGAEWVTYR